jgi:hypothetical protein
MGTRGTSQGGVGLWIQTSGSEAYLLNEEGHSLETHHWAVKSTNSGENRSAGSWGDGSSTTCFSCWNGVPQDS